MNVLNTLDVLVDVGDVYDPERNRYDHHQRSFGETTLDENHGIRLSSSGLVYKHFGRRVLAEIAGDLNEQELEEVYYKIYDNYMEEIDAHDNGVSQYDKSIIAKYKSESSISYRVSRMNPQWNDPIKDEDGQFLKAMNLVGEDFLSVANFYLKSWLPARTLVQHSLDQRYEIDETGSIIYLESLCPWIEHLHSLEKLIGAEIKIVIYKSSASDFRVQSVPIRPDSFENRAPLPEPWRGIRGDELSLLSGIDGCIFAHANGFIGGNKTLTGAVEMARKSISGI